MHIMRLDLRVLVNDDARLQAGTYGAMKEYNTSQFIEVNLRAPSTGEKVESIVSSFGELDGGSSYFDPSLKLKLYLLMLISICVWFLYSYTTIYTVFAV